LISARFGRPGLHHGSGWSDTLETLRRYFEVHCFHLAHATIAALAAEGKMTGQDVARAIKQYKIDSEKSNPIGVRRMQEQSEKAATWAHSRWAFKWSIAGR